MNSQDFNTVTPDFPPHLRKPIVEPCPDCEVRFPLQRLLAELLRKNQTLRMELQELQSQLTRSGIGQQEQEWKQER